MRLLKEYEDVDNELLENKDKKTMAVSFDQNG
jgi:hypothetical protein